jgi:hypothetical protein
MCRRTGMTSPLCVHFMHFVQRLDENAALHTSLSRHSISNDTCLYSGVSPELYSVGSSFEYRSALSVD